MFLRGFDIRTTIPDMKYLLCALAAVALFTGCLNVDMSAQIDRNGGGTLDLVYEFDSEFYALGVYDNSDVALPVPVSRDEFRRTADEIDGLRLSRYRMRETPETVTVEVRLRFTSVDVLNEWYGGGTSAVSLSSSGDQTRWSQVIAPGNGTTGDLAAEFGRSLDNYEFTFSLRAPSDIQGQSMGSVDERGRVATVRLSMADVVASTDEITWEVWW